MSSPFSCGPSAAAHRDRSTAHRPVAGENWLMSEGMTEADLGDDPIAAARRWLDDARQTDLALPDAMALATVSSQGAPSVRFVLCRGLDERGVTFFTNYESAKAS